MNQNESEWIRMNQLMFHFIEIQSVQRYQSFRILNEWTSPRLKFKSWKLEVGSHHFLMFYSFCCTESVPNAFTTWPLNKRGKTFFVNPRSYWFMRMRVESTLCLINFRRMPVLWAYRLRIGEYSLSILRVLLMKQTDCKSPTGVDYNLPKTGGTATGTATGT